MAVALVENSDAILAANKQDLAAARGRISDVMLDRLALTPARLADMAKGMREVAALPDPVGAVLRKIVRPNGLLIEKTSVPMGVIAIIYESRPNVTSDAAALADAVRKLQNVGETFDLTAMQQKACQAYNAEQNYRELMTIYREIMRNENS